MATLLHNSSKMYRPSDLNGCSKIQIYKKKPRWQSAAIFKNVKLSPCLINYDEIWYGDAHWPAKPNPIGY